MHLFQGENFLRYPSFTWSSVGRSRRFFWRNSRKGSKGDHLRSNEFAGSKKLHRFSASVMTVLALSVIFVDSSSTKDGQTPAKGAWVASLSVVKTLHSFGCIDNWSTSTSSEWTDVSPGFSLISASMSVTWLDQATNCLFILSTLLRILAKVASSELRSVSRLRLCRACRWPR